MRCHLMMLIVVLPVLLSSLEIQLAEGIKCYFVECSGSACVGKGVEMDCEANYDRCFESLRWMTLSNETRIDRSCSDKETEDHVKEIGLSCEDFRPVKNGSTTLSKQCFCYADLCNDKFTDFGLVTTPAGLTNDAPLITGHSTVLLLVIASIYRLSSIFLF
ncbi:putative arsenical pump-driving ATPase [Orchesella cincta]|uniref:Putative arsenical pump-driving ATPase n=1 Tax=Orchesella cincta TaxID=48709 RepID=A0A1D2M4H6_ORCCI|nr:putative arsenical pump-driving ATPase [Orchesella cincta]